MKPGIYRDVDPADYYADPCPAPSLTQSICKIIVERSALHAATEHPRLPPHASDDDEAEKYDKAKAIGNAAHAIMLGRGKQIEIIKANDFKGGEAKKLRDAAVAAGKAPVLEKHLALASDMTAAAWSQLSDHEDHDAFANGSGEVMIAWQEDDGLWCRALLDWLHDDLRAYDDYKSTGMSVAPHLLGYRAEAGGWHVQAAFIERGLDRLDPAGAGRRRFRYISQETDKPYALTSMHMSEHWMTMGRKVVEAGMSRWREAMRTGQWLGYTNRAVIPEFPGHRESKWLEREIAEFADAAPTRGRFDPKLIMAG